MLSTICVHFRSTAQNKHTKQFLYAIFVAMAPTVPHLFSLFALFSAMCLFDRGSCIMVVALFFQFRDSAYHITLNDMKALSQGIKYTSLGSLTFYYHLFGLG